MSSADPSATDSGTELLQLVIPTGKAVLQFLQNRKNGARIAEIVQHLRTEYKETNPDQLTRQVPGLLETGASLGLLERKGSRYADPNGGAQENGSEPSLRCRRRRSRRRRRCCCRRRRRRRRRRCCCRRRRRRRRRF